ncbi:hypothetical protein D9611_006053 [Ephemerocybe angulata]|uniref:RNA polymerase Rpb7-like N-terminal domain-containing protein n=1 Tax=Ephemerocybe angulata TaxID=980116 RepID=A0A8H5CGD0_9AGAR|nr:hypothetical protein D9611_006053 [Tulosesus angulatus]
MFFIHQLPLSPPTTHARMHTYRTRNHESWQKELTHTILLHPSYFGPQMTDFLENKLFTDVEGTCSGQFGYIIAVVCGLTPTPTRLHSLPKNRSGDVTDSPPLFVVLD